MNPRAVALIVLGSLIALGGLAAVVVWWIGQRAGVHRGDYVRNLRHLGLADEALEEIATEADRYSDIDSPLAAQVKTILRTHNRSRRELTK